MNKLQITSQHIDFVSKCADEVILFYSGGKDSIVLLDLLSKKFKKVHLVFMWLIPGLRHLEKYLIYALAKYSNVELLQYPHWMLNQYINDNYYSFHGIKVPFYKLVDIERAARFETGCEWIFTGQKMSDNMVRRIMLRQFLFDTIDLDQKRVHPLAHWNKADVIGYIKLKRLQMPIEYDNGASQGLDINRKTLLYLKAYWPQDFKLVVNCFPFAETLIINEDE